MLKGVSIVFCVALIRVVAKGEGGFFQDAEVLVPEESRPDPATEMCGRRRGGPSWTAG